MKVLAFSVFDEKISAFVSPFFAPTRGHAARSFGDAVSDPTTSLSKHPSDYKLYHVGEFDDATGEFASQVPPALIANGSDFASGDGAAGAAPGSVAPVEVIRRGRKS